jgi:hypothetical protein
MESKERRLECPGYGELMPALLLKYHEVVSNFDKIISVSNALFSICGEAVSNSPMWYNIVNWTKKQCLEP